MGQFRGQSCQMWQWEGTAGWRTQGTSVECWQDHALVIFVISEVWGSSKRGSHDVALTCLDQFQTPAPALKHQALCFALHEWLCCRTAWCRRRSLDRCKKLVPSHPREGWVSVGRCIASFHLHLNRFQEHGQDDRSLKIGMQRGERKICDVFQFNFLWFSCTQGLIPKRECYSPRCILMSPAADSCFTCDRADEPLRPALSRFDMETQRLGTVYCFGFCFFVFWLFLPLKTVLRALPFPLVVSSSSHFSVATVTFQVGGAAHQLAAGSWSPKTEKRAK